MTTTTIIPASAPACLTNSERSERAESAVNAFGLACGEAANPRIGAVREIRVQNLLAGLMHYCDAYNLDFNTVLAFAEAQYGMELDAESTFDDEEGDDA